MLSLPVWKKRTPSVAAEKTEEIKPLGFAQILKIPGAKEVLIAFFCYCALEQTAMLWGSTYLVRHIGMDEERAASLASLFFIGITSGRFLSGFLTYKFTDETMTRLGQGIIGLGVLVMLLPLGEASATVGLLMVGFGCAPIYPCVIHSTPAHFGEENSQAIIGVQMASAYTGIMIMPPIFGVLANHISVALLPWYLGGILVLMVAMCEILNKKTAK